MTHVAITPDGTVNVCAAATTSAAITQEVGEPGWDMIRLAKPDGMPRQFRAFVNDQGLVSDPPLARNPVGACMIVALGGSAGVYAGPVVFARWDEYAELVEMHSLDVAYLVSLHRVITDELEHGGPGPWSYWTSYADHVRTAPAPAPVVLTGQEALDYLRRSSGGAR